MKVLWFDRLDLASLCIAVVLRPFYRRVYFRTCVSIFQSDRVLAMLRAIGVEWYSYIDKPGNLYVDGCELINVLQQRFLENRVKHSHFYQWLISHYALDDVGIRKFNGAMTFTAFMDYFATGVSTVPLIRSDPTRPKTVFMPCRYLDAVLLDELEDPRIRISKIHVVVLSPGRWTRRALVAIRSLLSIARHRSADAVVKIQDDPAADDVEYTLAYFPHQGLTYGEYFRKTFVYSSEPEATLYRRKVLTCSIGPTDAASLRYMRLHKIPHLNLSDHYSRKAYLRQIISLYRGGGVRLRDCLREFGVFCALSKFVMSVEQFTVMVRRMPRVACVYAYYDVLFPQALVFALYLRRITTISSQERPVQFAYFSDLIYDHYLVLGPAFIPLLTQRQFTPEQFHVVGSSRSQLVRAPTNNQKYAWVADLKARYRIIVCFGLVPFNRFYIGVHGENGTSEKSNIAFADVLLQLAVVFKDCYFFLRYKEASDSIRILPPTLRDQIEAQDNIEIMTDLKRFNTYHMTYYADLVIGKQSCIVQEALAAGKPVIYYDDDHYLQAFPFLTELDNVARTPDELQGLVRNCLATNPIDSPEYREYLQRYFPQPPEREYGDTICKTITTIIEDQVCNRTS